MERRPRDVLCVAIDQREECAVGVADGALAVERDDAVLHAIEDGFEVLPLPPFARTSQAQVAPHALQVARHHERLLQ